MILKEENLPLQKIGEKIKSQRHDSLARIFNFGLYPDYYLWYEED